MRASSLLVVLTLPLFLYRSAFSSTHWTAPADGRLHDTHAVIQYQANEQTAVAAAIAKVPIVGHEVNAAPTDGTGSEVSATPADSTGSVDPVADPVAASPPPSSPPTAVPEYSNATKPSRSAELPRWLQPDASALTFNAAAREQLSPVTPKGTTLHFTFGSSIMMDFVKNWLHFVRRAQPAMSPLLVGAADAALLRFCNEQGVPAAAIIPELDVWTYKRREKVKDVVYEMKSEWKYFRHHNSDFLEMGLIKVTCTWELLNWWRFTTHSLTSQLNTHGSPPLYSRLKTHRSLQSKQHSPLTAHHSPRTAHYSPLPVTRPRPHTLTIPHTDHHHHHMPIPTRHSLLV